MWEKKHLTYIRSLIILYLTNDPTIKISNYHLSSTQAVSTHTHTHTHTQKVKINGQVYECQLFCT